MKIYAHHHLVSIRNLHSKLLGEQSRNMSLGPFIEAYAHNLKMGFMEQNQAVYTDISNYYKPLMGKNKSEVFLLELSNKVFLDIAASVHGFDTFEQIAFKSEPLDYDFLSVVDLLLRGEVNELVKQLLDDPTLTNRHSQFGHKAQLIHYCASNAVELYRQVVPYNLLDIIQVLLKQGADPKVKIPVYGGHFDFFELFSTSAHPRESGVDLEVYKFFDSEQK